MLVLAIYIIPACSLHCKTNERSIHDTYPNNRNQRLKLSIKLDQRKTISLGDKSEIQYKVTTSTSCNFRKGFIPCKAKNKCACTIENKIQFLLQLIQQLNPH